MCNCYFLNRPRDTALVLCAVHRLADEDHPFTKRNDGLE